MPVQEMGCVVSDVQIHSEEEADLKNYLTKEEIALVQESWGILRQDIDDVGLVIFKRLFGQSKHLKKLFTERLGCDGQIYDEHGDLVFDEQKIRDHARIVMEALGSAVECLHDCDKLTSILLGIGERHVMYGVLPEMVPLLWPPIITTFEERLGPNFTPQIGQAWENVFTYVCNTVTEGMLRWSPKSEGIGQHDQDHN